MQTSVRRFLWAGVAALVALVAVPVASAFGAGSVTTTFTRTSDWGSGHEVRVTITNGSDATVNTWRVEFDLPAGTTISSFWDADVTRTGNHYVATKKSWAGPLAPGPVAELGLHRHRRLPGADRLHDQRRALRRRTTPPTTAPPTTAPPTAGPPTTAAVLTAADHDRRPPGGKKVVGYFVEWGVYQRNYHVKNIAHQRLGRQADPHPLRVRQRHRRPVRDRRHATPTTTRPTPPARASTASPTPGTQARCAATSTSCASSSGCTRTSRSSGRSAAGPGPAASARPRRTRPRSPTPATTWSRTRAGPTSSTASTSTGSTRTPAA